MIQARYTLVMEAYFSGASTYKDDKLSANLGN